MLAVTLNMLARARDHTDVLEHATLKGTNIVLSMEEIVPHMRFLSQLMKFEFVFEVRWMVSVVGLLVVWGEGWQRVRIHVPRYPPPPFFS